ncbi:hypothetical protein MPSEU_000683500 [Mayamaea pseudoterrestris]|nr:hypothetical protein MPSEU_000683500 [Mayamaea pseudoterrestris]
MPPIPNSSNASSSSSSKLSWLTPVIGKILVVETGERFAFFGFRAILVLYFTNALRYSDSQAISYYSFTTCLAYLSPIIGAVVADGWLGRYRTILQFGIVYVIGLAILALGASSQTLFDASLSVERLLSFGGLFLVCLGTGGIKPCVSSFGADQITLANDGTSSSSDESVGLASLNAKPESGNRRQGNNNLLVSADELIQDAHLSVIDPREKVSALVDEDIGKEEHVRQFFSWFYFCINVGALTSIAIIPLVKGNFGFGPAFSISFLFMVTAMVLFLSSRNEYKHITVDKDSTLLTTFTLCWWCIRQQVWSISFIARTFPWCKPGPARTLFSSQSMYATLPSRDETEPAEQQEQPPVDQDDADCTEDDALFQQQLADAAQVVRILPVMAMFPIFWCLYDQQASVWTLQAARMDLMGVLEPEQMTLINPLEIMIFIPLFDQVVYPFLVARNVNIDPLRRISWGMGLAALSFVVSSLVEDDIQYRLNHNLPRLNVMWQLPQLTILSIGEIFLSVTSLEFAYAVSPDRLKTFVTSLYLLTTAVGNLIGGILYSTVFANMPLAPVLRTCSLLMLLNLGLFLLVKRNWDRQGMQRARPLEELELEPGH